MASWFSPSVHLSKLVISAALVVQAGCSTQPPAAPVEGVSSVDDRDAALTVSTDTGPVRGIHSSAADAFLGIPYAAPPVGALRWAPPSAAAPWTERRDAKVFGSACSQLDNANNAIGSEDCLTLNVWRPSTRAGEPLPVMVFLHGGGNTRGSSADRIYDGASLAANQNVIVVSLNYRLGVFGFLSLPSLDTESPQHTSGNYGLLDQIAALRWIQRNVRSFGGDPARVLLSGESAGGSDTCLLISSPLAAGLFSSALIGSGPCSIPSKDTVQSDGAKIVDALGCTGAPDITACLRRQAAPEMLAKIPRGTGLVSAFRYRANIDGYVLPEAPSSRFRAGRHNHVPVVIGANADEAASPEINTTIIRSAMEYFSKLEAMFGAGNAAAIARLYPLSAFATPNKAFIAVLTDLSFVCPARETARALAAGQSEPVYRYFFAHAMDSGPAAPLGAFHGIELAYVFGHFNAYTPSPRENDLVNQIQADWRGFAATGVPDQGGTVKWPTYQEALDPYIQLDTPVTVNAGLRKVRCDLWDALGLMP